MSPKSFSYSRKGIKKDYRPISLLPHLYNLFTRIILARMEKQLDDNQPREQAGFRSGFRTSDHLQALSQVIEKSKDHQFNLCLGFVDDEKALDSLDHQLLLTALEKLNIDGKYIKIIKAIYKEPTVRVHLDDTITDLIAIMRGVRQGDPVSPELFTATLKEVFKNIDWVKFGTLSYIFRDYTLPISLKRQVFDQCIIPVLSYGAETWTTTKRLEKKLRVTERAMERIMIGVTKDRVTNEDLRKKSRVQDIIKTIK